MEDPDETISQPYDVCDCPNIMLPILDSLDPPTYDQNSHSVPLLPSPLTLTPSNISLLAQYIPDFRNVSFPGTNGSLHNPFVNITRRYTVVAEGSSQTIQKNFECFGDFHSIGDAFQAYIVQQGIASVDAGDGGIYDLGNGSVVYNPDEITPNPQRRQLNATGTF